jgi:hypothetical protein
MPDPTQASGLFWATVFGAALGVMAGTLIQYLVTLLLNQRTRRRQKNALMKEFVYNRSLVDELLAELQNFRNAVNGDALNTYFGYFGFSRAIFAQANACTINGMLYELFSADEIRHAQRIVSLLSAANENWVNGEIKRRRDTLINTPAQFNKAEAVQFVNFLENQIRDVANWMDGLMRKVQPTRWPVGSGTRFALRPSA